MNTEIIIKENTVTINEYLGIRKMVNWKKLSEVQAKKALDNSLYYVGAYKGDEIVGFITKSNGITIHRKNCSNVIHLDERIVDVKFNEITKNKYLSNILIVLKNNQNRLGDILNKISGKNIIIDSVHTLYKDNVVSYKITLYVNNLDSLEKLISELAKIRYVKEVTRL